MCIDSAIKDSMSFWCLGESITSVGWALIEAISWQQNMVVARLCIAKEEDETGISSEIGSMIEID
jgi:hypothetical protein